MGKDIKIAVTVGILVTLIVLVLWLVKDNTKAVDEIKRVAGGAPAQAARRDTPEAAPTPTERRAAGRETVDTGPAPAGRTQRAAPPVYVPEPARQAVRAARRTTGATETPDGERLVARIGRTQRPDPEAALPDVGRSRPRFDGVGAEPKVEEAEPKREVPKEPEAAAAKEETQPAGAKTYTVVANDNLSNISRKVYGSTKHWKKIQAANKDRFPNGSTLVHTGWKLKIPPLDASAVVAAIPRPEPEQETASATVTARIHVVQKGQTLYQIARKYYQNGRKWRVIYDANKATFPDPDRIPAGASLRIPQEG